MLSNITGSNQQNPVYRTSQGKLPGFYKIYFAWKKKDRKRIPTDYKGLRDNSQVQFIVLIWLTIWKTIFKFRNGKFDHLLGELLIIFGG